MSRTQIVCLCEGERGKSIDPVFIYHLMRHLRPSWINSEGSNGVPIKPLGGRSTLIKKMPDELKQCLKRGAQTTLMVWADCDHDCGDPEVLKQRFWAEAEQQQITREQFDKVVFVLPKDRLENWIELLNDGSTDESNEGRRLKHSADAKAAAKKLAEHCRTNTAIPSVAPSLEWSCKSWRALRDRMSS